MIRLDTNHKDIWNRPSWYQNFLAEVKKEFECSRRYTQRGWHIIETNLLKEHGGKISFREARRYKFYVFEEDKHATLFMLKWT